MPRIPLVVFFERMDPSHKNLLFEDVVRHTTGVPVHDMVPSFEGLDESFVENFKVDRHHKAEGHRMMAEHMANDIGHGLTHNNTVESQVEGNMA